MCAGCRERAAKHELVRFVVADEPPFIAADIGHKLGGRGVSVHPRRSCLAAALRRGGFARAAGRAIPIRERDLARSLVEQYNRRIDGLLLAARRVGQLGVGTDAVRDDIAAERTRLLVVAADAAGRREELTRAAERLGGACVVFGTKDSLGRRLGRAETGVLSVNDRGIAEEIADVAARVAALSEDE